MHHTARYNLIDSVWVYYFLSAVWFVLFSWIVEFEWAFVLEWNLSPYLLNICLAKVELCGYVFSYEEKKTVCVTVICSTILNLRFPNGTLLWFDDWAMMTTFTNILPTNDGPVCVCCWLHYFALIFLFRLGFNLHDFTEWRSKNMFLIS